MIRVKVFSHHFTVDPDPGRDTYAVEFFAKKLVQWGVVKERGQWVRQIVNYFYSRTNAGRTWRFHIGTYKNFITRLTEFGLDLSTLEVQHMDIPKPLDIELLTNTKFTPREDQPAVLEYLADTKSRRKLINLQTGKGKGLCAMFGAAKLGYRVLCVLKPMYIEKWAIEFKEKLIVDDSDIHIVSGGSDKLHWLLNNIEKVDAKIIIVSNAIMRNWINEYEETHDAVFLSKHKCLPQDLCEHLGVGLRLIDELHQDFHFNFKLDLYTNIAWSYSMSATLTSNNVYIKMMQDVMHPPAEQPKLSEYDRYCSVVSWRYNFWNPQKIRTAEYGQEKYSHNALEQSIMRHQPTLQHYFAMIADCLDMHFYRNDKFKPGYKSLIFCYSKEMCGKLVSYLRSRYPGRDIRRYVDVDPKENLLEAEVCVSTLVGAGTAFDIPGLLTVIQTTAVASHTANLQSLGRLRKLSDGSSPTWIFFSSWDFDKHMEYERQKKELLGNKAASYHSFDYNRKI